MNFVQLQTDTGTVYVNVDLIAQIDKLNGYDSFYITMGNGKNFKVSHSSNATVMKLIKENMK